MYKWWFILLLSIILFSCDTTKRGGERDNNGKMENLRKKGQKSKPVIAKNRTYGYISAMSLPAVYIKIDGKNIKRSPLVRYKLTTGKHKITFYDEKKKIYAHEWVNITKGKVTPIIKKFE